MGLSALDVLGASMSEKAGTAVPDVEDASINWLAGSAPDLTERELMLVDQARATAYVQGEEHGYRRGYRQGMLDAVAAMTTITTAVSERQVLEAIKTLNALTHAQETA